MVLRRIGVWSAAKFNGVIYALVGLVIGVIVSLLSMVGAMAGAQAAPDNAFGPFFAMFVGVGAIIIAPLFYGVCGLIAGAIGAAVYNFAAGIFGGLELEFEDVKRAV